MKNNLKVYECSMDKCPNVIVGKETIRMMYGMPVIESRYNPSQSSIKTMELTWKKVHFGTKQTQATKYPNHPTYYSVSFQHPDAVMINMTCNQENYTCLKFIYQVDTQYIIWKMSLETYRKLVATNDMLTNEHLLSRKYFGEKEAKNIKSVLEYYRKNEATIPDLEIIRKKSETTAI